MDLLSYLSVVGIVGLILKRATSTKTIDIKCITFDLDDTIWQCQPVIERAADAFYTYMRANFPKIVKLYPTKKEWRKLSAQVTKENPDKKHDLTLIRKICLKRVAIEANLNPKDVIEPCYKAFIDSRNNIEDYLFPDAISVLERIHKSGIQIGAISNGNAAIDNIPILKKYFDFAVNPETAGQKKPDMAPFKQALELSCATNSAEILHVGDSLTSDVHPAKLFGCGLTVWVKTGSVWSGTSPTLCTEEQLSKGTGDVEITSLNELIPALQKLKILPLKF
jgi:HAD superfamily hydrolase (TIGR01549 family)